jgi:serine/threonine-protein kinase
VLVLGGAWWGLSRADAPSGDVETRGAAGGGAAPPGVRGRAVAVMPLVAVGDDARARAVAEGLTSQLAGALARVPGLRVSPAPVAGPAGDSSSAVAPVAAPIVASVPVAAGALLVRGTVQREGELLRVVLRVDDAVADSTLWSESFDRGADAVFALQDDAARALVAALAARAGAPRTP